MIEHSIDLVDKMDSPANLPSKLERLRAFVNTKILRKITLTSIQTLMEGVKGRIEKNRRNDRKIIFPNH